MFSRDPGENSRYHARGHGDNERNFAREPNFPFIRQIDATESVHKRSCYLPDTLDTNTLKNTICDQKGSKANFGGTLTSNIKKIDYKKSVHFNLRSCINPDILIKIGNNNIYGHRTLLREFTDFFEKPEAVPENYCVRIPEDKVTAKAFDTIYNWMLMSQDEPPTHMLNRKNLMEVYIAAQYLSIKELVNLCRSMIDDEDLFSEGNAFFLFMDAYHFGCKELMDQMLPRIQRFFLPLISTDEFLRLPINVLCQLLSSNFICVHCELEVFFAGARWLLCEWESRENLAPIVMKTVRFGLMTPSQLVDIRRSPDSPEILHITGLKEVKKFIDDGMAFAVKVHCHDGDIGEVSRSCKVLGLSAPEMRNWIGKDKFYTSYQDFLDELDDLRKEPK